MIQQPVIAIIDAGKTNKKLFLLDEDYHVVFEQTEHLAETTDEDGYPCEAIDSLRLWVLNVLKLALSDKKYQIRAINFSAYGASFALLDGDGKPVAPLYNYLKPYPEALKNQFYNRYGGEAGFASQTASPVLGSLNSGMQLYRLKQQNLQTFNQVRYALHLPQYLSYLLTGIPASDITSIGCHTNLWDFTHQRYHPWVHREGIFEKLAPILPADTVLPATIHKLSCRAGIGLHDSSAALIPYLASVGEPFVLLSTGTWSISMNPFNYSALTESELENDCLCYLQQDGRAVKSSRFFAGHQHDEQTKRIGAHFNQQPEKYAALDFDPRMVKPAAGPAAASFNSIDLNCFESDVAAYYSFMAKLVDQQAASTQLVLHNSPVNKLFVDGGFSKNAVYMNLLANAFADTEVYAAFVAQATAIGAAMVIHTHWNHKNVPVNVIRLTRYLPGHPVSPG